MSNAVVPRMQGDDYQARFFWIQACRLFEAHSKVACVAYELDTVKYFDDVAVFYGPLIPDERGDLIRADYYQVKFHVSHAGAFTWEALMDPRFIGASSMSLLQRLHAAQELLAPDGRGCRFHLVAPWPAHPDDPLSRIISNQGGELRQRVLFDGSGPRSTMGGIRAAWREHLGLTDDEGLARVLRPFRIHTNAGDLEAVRDRLNDKLRLAGFAPVEEGCQAHPYDDLIRKLHAMGCKKFNRVQLQEIGEREGLWRGRPVQNETALQLGVRSFMRWAEYMEDETDQMLCLVRYFDGRSIREPQLWQEAVFRGLADFLSHTVRQQRLYHLHLDAHTSIAFAAGYCLDSKSGADVMPVQRTRSGKALWRPQSGAARDLPLWSYQEHSCTTGRTDVALAISVTHDVLNDVKLYVTRALSSVGRIIACTVLPQPTSTAVQDGTHALLLAQELSSLIRRKRSVEERLGVLHIFAAAPNGFVFFLGQLARSFGRCVLYEYDFERNSPGGYQPSLAFPPHTSPSVRGPISKINDREE
jgi:hypothetical protein